VVGWRSGRPISRCRIGRLGKTAGDHIGPRFRLLHGAPAHVRCANNVIITFHSITHLQICCLRTTTLFVFRPRCTYQALVDDVLEYRLNRVSVKDEGGSGAPKTYDLEVEQDLFWRKNAPRPFPEAIDDNSTELERIKRQEKEIKSKTAAGGSDIPSEGVVSASTGEGGTQDLLATVDSLPKLLEVRSAAAKRSSSSLPELTVPVGHCSDVILEEEKVGVPYEYSAGCNACYRGERASGVLRS
jgi:hypothetical protein